MIKLNFGNYYFINKWKITNYYSIVKICWNYFCIDYISCLPHSEKNIYWTYFIAEHHISCKKYKSTAVFGFVLIWLEVKYRICSFVYDFWVTFTMHRLLTIIFFITLMVEFIMFLSPKSLKLSVFNKLLGDFPINLGM